MNKLYKIESDDINYMNDLEKLYEENKINLENGNIVEKKENEEKEDKEEKKNVKSKDIENKEEENLNINLSQNLNNYGLISNIGVGLRIIYNLFMENKNDNKKIIKNIFIDLKNQCNALNTQIKSILNYFPLCLNCGNTEETDLKKQFKKKKKYIQFLIKIIDKNMKTLENGDIKNLFPIAIDIKKKNIPKDILRYFNDLGIIYFELEEVKDKKGCSIF